MCLFVSEVYLYWRTFCVFPWWLQNVKRGSKIVTIQMSAILKFDFQQRKRLYFFSRKLSRLHQEVWFWMWQLTVHDQERQIFVQFKLLLIKTYLFKTLLVLISFLHEQTKCNFPALQTLYVLIWRNCIEEYYLLITFLRQRLYTRPPCS